MMMVSDGLLVARPEPPDKIWLQRINAMGLHDRDARLELVFDGTTVLPTATVGELLQYLYARCEISRRQQITLSFWGKPLEDERKSLAQCKVVTNSELTMKTTTRSLSQLVAIRRAAPLQRVRISSHKLASFAVEALTPATTAGALRAAVHAHIHAPLTYLAVVDSKPEADTLKFRRGDQLVKDSGGGGGKKDKGGGLKMRHLRSGAVGAVAAAESLIECKVDLADVRLFYESRVLPDDRTLDELGVLHDDLVFVDIKRPLPFDPDPDPVVAKAEKAGKAKKK